MRDVRNLNIWKQDEDDKGSGEAFMDAELAELNLSVRSYNCLKRMGCHTIRDIFSRMGEDGNGLLKIKGFGKVCEKEVMEKLKEFEASYVKKAPTGSGSVKRIVVKPAKKVWEMKIDQFHLSQYTYQKLSACGIRQVRDLYAADSENEPGWYAVRELFERIASTR